MCVCCWTETGTLLSVSESILMNISTLPTLRHDKEIEPHVGICKQMQSGPLMLGQQVWGLALTSNGCSAALMAKPAPPVTYTASLVLLMGILLECVCIRVHAHACIHMHARCTEVPCTLLSGYPQQASLPSSYTPPATIVHILLVAELRHILLVAVARDFSSWFCMFSWVSQLQNRNIPCSICTQIPFGSWIFIASCSQISCRPKT